MENNLPETKKTMGTKILSLISAVFFLIGSVYYSYIHIKTAYSSMHTIINTKLPDGTNETSWEFSFSNINLPAVLSVLLVLALGAMTVLLFVFAFKDRLHILSAALSALILPLQLILHPYTQLQDYMFARFSLGLRPQLAFPVSFLLKFVPFAVALLLSVICFFVAVRPQSIAPSEGSD